MRKNVFSLLRNSKWILLFICILFICSGVRAQVPTGQKVLATGIANDKAGTLLPKVSVTEKGTNNVTATDDSYTTAQTLIHWNLEHYYTLK